VFGIYQQDGQTKLAGREQCHKAKKEGERKKKRKGR
jgi:hypothetical protein